MSRNVTQQTFSIEYGDTPSQQHSDCHSIRPGFGYGRERSAQRSIPGLMVLRFDPWIVIGYAVVFAFVPSFAPLPAFLCAMGIRFYVNADLLAYARGGQKPRGLDSMG
jgi:hypothetical protein